MRKTTNCMYFFCMIAVVVTSACYHNNDRISSFEDIQWDQGPENYEFNKIPSLVYFIEQEVRDHHYPHPIIIKDYIGSLNIKHSTNVASIELFATSVYTLENGVFSEEKRLEELDYYSEILKVKIGQYACALPKMMYIKKTNKYFLKWVLEISDYPIIGFPCVLVRDK